MQLMPFFSPASFQPLELQREKQYSIVILQRGSLQLSKYPFKTWSLYGGGDSSL
jgi:hypothetical protein